MKNVIRITLFLFILLSLSFLINTILDNSFPLIDTFSYNQESIKKEINLADNLIKSGNLLSCNQLNNPLIKDVCFLDIIIEALDPRVISKDNCVFISDPYIQSFCVRLVTLRPHMRNFLLRRSSLFDNLSLSLLLPECNFGDDYYNLRCLFSKAGSVTHDSLSQAKQICFTLNKNELVGECLYYVADVLFQNLNNVTYNNFTFFMNFCEKVPHSSWRAECYYLLADHLALDFLKSQKWNLSRLKMIADACTKSYNEIDYHCSNHLARFLPFERRGDFCNLFNDFGERANCYIAWTDALPKGKFNNISTKINLCYNLSLFSDFCLWGLSKTIGFIPLNNFSVGIENCNNIPKNFRRYCFEGQIQSFKRYLGFDEVLKKINNCNSIPEEFISSCFRGLGRHFYHYTNRNINPLNSICNKVPYKFREYCFEGLGRRIGLVSEANIDEAILVCNNISFDFRKNCFFGFGKVSGWLFSGNISKGLYGFKKLPLAFQESFFQGFGSIINWRYSLNSSQLSEKCNKLPKEFRHYCFNGSDLN